MTLNVLIKGAAMLRTSDLVVVREVRARLTELAEHTAPAHLDEAETSLRQVLFSQRVSASELAQVLVA